MESSDAKTRVWGLYQFALDHPDAVPKRVRMDLSGAARKLFPREWTNDRMRRWYAANKENINERKRASGRLSDAKRRQNADEEWRERKREDARHRMRRWRGENREHAREVWRRNALTYAATHREECRARSKAWRERQIA